MRILVALALLALGFVASGQERSFVMPRLLEAHELQMPVEQEALQRQFDALSAMRLQQLEYSASGPVTYLHGDTGIVLPESVRSLKKGDSAAGVFRLFRDILLANGSEVIRVEANEEGPLGLRLSQTIRGIPVYQGGIAVTYDPTTLRVSQLSAHFVPDRGLQRTPRLSARKAEQVVAEAIGGTPSAVVEMLDGTHLAYHLGVVISTAQRPDGSRPPWRGPLSARLVWVIAVAMAWDEIRVVDADTGKIVDSMSGRPTICWPTLVQPISSAQ